MSQYPGSQPPPPPPPPSDPYYGQPPADAYGTQPPPAPSDPYFGAPAGDPYAPPQDPYYGQPSPEQYAQQQAWYAQQQARPPAPPAREARASRGGSGAAIFGLLLVLAGAWILFGDRLDVDLDWSELWPVGAVILGALMVVASVVPRRGSEGG